jgi:SAM-dependent methyltransferase
VFWKFNTPVVRCPACGLLYANPRWKAEHLFGRYTADYWARYAAEVGAAAQDPARQAWWRSCLQERAAGPPGRLLDVGCATGEFLVLARAQGWAAHGLEAVPEAAEVARARGFAVHAGPLDTAPWEPGSFDAVTLRGALSRRPDPRAALAQVVRLLKPDGILLLTSPNIRGLSYAALGHRWEVIDPNDHLTYFAPRPLARLLHATGFAVHRMETTLPGVELWRRWLYFPLFQRAAPLVHTLTRPLVARLLLGDEILVFARRQTSTEQ